ncbi:MAG: metallophosphoesterase [Woeseiaceae bacterium]
MLIAQISDTHILAPTSDHPAVQLRADCLRRCVEDINRQQPDAVIFTGDTTQHGQPDEYASLRELLAPLKPPLYLIPGNRDDNGALRTSFGDQLYLPRNGDFLHYVIEDHAVRLVALDSTSTGERKGVFCPARQAWLDDVLSEQPIRPTLLFIHHPPFDVDEHYVGGYRRPEEAAALADLVRRHPQVVGLICGHVHWLIECRWAGRPARIMPSVAVDLRKGIDEAEAREQPIYLLHRLSDETGLVSQARSVDGGVWRGSSACSN